ncbi:MAG: bifunctional oligoribonuclease/PAP phosphatase NrnA [Acidobacteriota bacterium]|nr:bifunctional oligoribonuclease/PAP phosphatase NrnA [Acidobacteriota bacterium]
MSAVVRRSKTAKRRVLKKAKRRARRAGAAPRGRRRKPLAAAAGGGPRWKLLLPHLRRGRQAVISTHVNPDGDGLGSQLALAAYLKQRGLRVAIVNSDPVPRAYGFMDPRGEILTCRDPAARRAMDACKLLFALDNGTLSRMGDLEGWIRETPAFKICIDHHASQDDIWDLRLIDEGACSTGTLIYQMIRTLGARLNPAQALAIYVALITDTGYFRFSRTDASTYRLAADLLDAGVDPIWVYHEVYERNSLAYLRLLGTALSNVNIECGGRLGWVSLSRQQIDEVDGGEEDTSEIVNSLLTLDGIRMALLLKEMPAQKTKVSLRSKGEIDVNVLAGRFGGGGHRNAAGILLAEPLERGVERVLEQARRLLAAES